MFRGLFVHQNSGSNKSFRKLIAYATLTFPSIHFLKLPTGGLSLHPKPGQQKYGVIAGCIGSATPWNYFLEHLLAQACSLWRGEDISLNVEQPQSSCWVFRTCPRVEDIHYCKWCSNESVPNFTSGEAGEEKGYTQALRLDSRFDNCAWFTMFRNPIPRLVSVFYCRKRRIGRTCATRQMPEEAHHDIIAFAKHWGNFAVR